MGTGSTPPIEQARSIFSDLGYTISGEGREFDAERKWRVVRVTATADGEAPTDDAAEYRCFVTWVEHLPALERRLLRDDPSYEWAIIAVDRDGDYEVREPPAAG